MKLTLANRPELITIDLDGTLVDSVRDLHKAINLTQQKFKLPASTESDIRCWIGNGIEKLVHRALTKQMNKNADPALFSKVFPQFIENYAQTNGQYSTLYPSVTDFLQKAKARSIPLVCITNKARQFAEPLLAHQNIDQYFDYLIAGDDVEHKKPHPQALLKAAQLCKANAQNCLMIGDSISDIQAAKNAGFHIICVSYGYNHGTDIRQLTQDYAADFVVDSFAELYPII